MRNPILLGLFLAVVWLVNSGHYNPLMLFFAITSIVLVLILAHRMDLMTDAEQQPPIIRLKLIPYLIWLSKEIVLSAWTVSKLIWQGASKISPTMAYLPISQQGDHGQVLYANSITLTPGTVAIILENNQILVHALCQDGVEDLQNGEMDRRAQQVEA